jgi:hypothetical protein
MLEADLSCAVQEGLYLSRKGIDPYSGGPFHHVRITVLLTWSRPISPMVRLVVTTLPVPLLDSCPHRTMDITHNLDIIGRSCCMGIRQYMEATTRRYDQHSRHVGGCCVSAWHTYVRSCQRILIMRSQIPPQPLYFPVHIISVDIYIRQYVGIARCDACRTGYDFVSRLRS